MNGIRYDFENNDIMIGANGSFVTTVIDGQNAALISLSQVCRLTHPETGAQVGSRIINQRSSRVSAILAEAKRQVERDGGTGVIVEIQNGNLYFKATYND